MTPETLGKIEHFFGKFNPQPSFEAEVVDLKAYENGNSPETFFVITRKKQSGEIFEVYETEKRFNIGEEVEVVPMVNLHHDHDINGSITFYDIAS
jgi:hypothetical protein